MEKNIIITSNNDNNENLNLPDLEKEKESKVKVDGIESFLNNTVKHLVPYRKFERVNDNLLRYLYLRTSRLRECIDGIAAEISSRTALLIPIEKNLSQNSLLALEKFAQDFFSSLNRKKDTIQSLINRIVRDLLIFDRFCIEKVRNRKGILVELYARDPSQFVIDKSPEGVFVAFRQVVEGQEVEFKPEDIIYGVLHPSSFDDYGIPIIEGILDEVASLILATKLIANNVFDDSTPPGILVLGELGEAAYAKLKKEFTDPKLRNRIKVIRNISPQEVDWIKLDRSLTSENKIDYLLARVDQIIYKAFQVPTEKEITSRAGSETAYKISQSRLIEPIVRLIEDAFTKEIFLKEYNLPVKFKLLNLPDISSQEFYDKARGISALINTGVLSFNEAREILGLIPVAGGNKRFVKLGNEIVEYDESTGEPKRLPEFME